MAKSTKYNMCRRALLNGRNVCKGEDLLTVRETWCRVLDLPNVNTGCLDTALIKKSSLGKKRSRHKINGVKYAENKRQILL